MQQPIIFTRDKHTADMLLKEGFPLINKSADGWTFLNSSSEKFSKVSADKKGKVCATDKLFF